MGFSAKQLACLRSLGMLSQGTEPQWMCGHATGWPDSVGNGKLARDTENFAWQASWTATKLTQSLLPQIDQSQKDTGSNHAISALKFKIIREFLDLGYNVLLSDIDVVWLDVSG